MLRVAQKTFAPERWGWVDKFLSFYGRSYGFSEFGARVLNGVRQHTRKAGILIQEAHEFLPELKEERLATEKYGHNSGAKAEVVGCLVEAALIEMYSSVDCAIKVLRELYGQQSRGFSDSTRRTFAEVDKISGAFPDEIKALIRGASWYTNLRRARDEITHAGTGYCVLDDSYSKVVYLHFGFSLSPETPRIDNVFEWLGSLQRDVECFLEKIFHYLFATLSSNPVLINCGYDGEVYFRCVDPTKELNFDSGHCFSYRDFDGPESKGPCPFQSGCGAYSRKWPVEVRAPVGPSPTSGFRDLTKSSRS